MAKTGLILPKGNTAVGRLGNRRGYTTWFLFSIAVAGSAASAYAAWEKLEVDYLGTSEALCNLSAVVSCDRVSASPWANFLGAPLGVWGAAFFLSVAFHAWGARRSEPLVHALAWNGLASLALIGVIVTLGLFLISIGFIRALCLICLAVDVLCLLLAFVTWGKRLAIRKTVRALYLVTSWTLSVAIAASAVIGYRVAAPGLSKWLLVKDIARYDAQGELKQFLDLADPHPDLAQRFRLHDAPTIGDPNAKVLLVEFVDLLCPSCAAFSTNLRRLIDDFGGQLIVVARHFPLDKTCNRMAPDTFHEGACDIALLAICAHQRGQFWGFANGVFADQWNVNKEATGQIASALHLDPSWMASCGTSEATRARLASDLEMAAELRIRATPALFFNGFRYKGPWTYGAYRRTIKLLLRHEDARR